LGAVHIGYFEDFLETDTLLLAGDEDGLRELVDSLRALADGQHDEIAIHTLAFAVPHREVQLVAVRSAEDIGIKRRGAREFEWRRDPSGWRDSAEKVLTLSQCEHGHHYLDAQGDEATVMVS
jgi:hypothetical protein